MLPWHYLESHILCENALTPEQYEVNMGLFFKEVCKNSEICNFSGFSWETANKLAADIKTKHQSKTKKFHPILQWKYIIFNEEKSCWKS